MNSELIFCSQCTTIYIPIRDQLKIDQHTHTHSISPPEHKKKKKIDVNCLTERKLFEFSCAYVIYENRLFEYHFQFENVRILFSSNTIHIVCVSLAVLYCWYYIWSIWFVSFSSSFRRWILFYGKYILSLMYRMYFCDAICFHSINISLNNIDGRQHRMCPKYWFLFTYASHMEQSK